MKSHGQQMVDGMVLEYVEAQRRREALARATNERIQQLEIALVFAVSTSGGVRDDDLLLVDECKQKWDEALRVDIEQWGKER